MTYFLIMTLSMLRNFLEILQSLGVFSRPTHKSSYYGDLDALRFRTTHVDKMDPS